MTVADPMAGTSSHRASTAAVGTLTFLRKKTAAARHSPTQAASCIQATLPGRSTGPGTTTPSTLTAGRRSA